MIERIDGDRINLRKIRHGDAKILARRINDVTVARNTFVPYPYGVKDARKFIRNSVRQWHTGIGYQLMIEEPADSSVIGCVGLESVSKKHRNAEMGYWLWKKYRGCGIMSEAVDLALRFAFQELNLVRVHAHVMQGNVASTRVLERAGFQPEGYMRKRIKHRGRWKDLYLFSLLDEEWRV